jgi:hypothetical protein
MEYLPFRFFNDPIQVEFNQLPALEKSPPCPQAFIWRHERYIIQESLAEWVDFARRGRMRNNMRPEHAARAALRGSWGVGVFYFRVRIEDGRVFDLYYDRAPQDVDRRKGAWYLDKELKPAES